MATCTIVVVRHGERLDYMLKDRGENWTATAAEPWNAPLTAHGQSQAAAMGKELFENKKIALPPITRVYSSPLLRCRQTAAGILRAYRNHAMSSGGDESCPQAQADIPPVRIEEGLMESLNESWYRSWALPGSNGTWGYIPPSGDRTVDPDTLHPMACQPVQAILQKHSEEKRPKNDTENDEQADSTCWDDKSYKSQTKIVEPFQFVNPRLLESRTDQRNRLRSAVEQLARPEETVVLVSHGGPVTHLYESLTGRSWKEHGSSSYCCYSVYQQQQQLTDESAGDNNKNIAKWKPLVVNESSYLHERTVQEDHLGVDEGIDTGNEAK